MTALGRINLGVSLLFVLVTLAGLALLCGELMAAWLHAEPLPIEAKLARALRAERLSP